MKAWIAACHFCFQLFLEAVKQSHDMYVGKWKKKKKKHTGSVEKNKTKNARYYVAICPVDRSPCGSVTLNLWLGAHDEKYVPF